MFCIAIPLCCVVFVAQDHLNYKRLFPKYDESSNQLISYSRFIRENTNYYDVVFSNFIVADENPPELLALGHKRVYLTVSTNSIYNVVNNIKDDYNVKMILRYYNQFADARIIEFLSHADQTVQLGENVKLYMFTKKSILATMQSYNGISMKLNSNFNVFKIKENT